MASRASCLSPRMNWTKFPTIETTKATIKKMTTTSAPHIASPFSFRVSIVNLPSSVRDMLLQTQADSCAGLSRFLPCFGKSNEKFQRNDRQEYSNLGSYYPILILLIPSFHCEPPLIIGYVFFQIIGSYYSEIALICQSVDTY